MHSLRPRGSAASLRNRPAASSADHQQEGDVFLPPHYGRPRASPPELLSTFIPSLSRPSSRSPSRAPSPSRSPSEPTQKKERRSSTSLPYHFPPRPLSAPGPTVESQGFILYLSSGLLFIFYLLWSFSPSRNSEEGGGWLEGLGVGWYPAREWSLLFPSWLTILVLYTYIAYMGINLYITPSIDSLRSLTDTQANILEKKEMVKMCVGLGDDGIPVLHDLPVGIVNQVVFG